MALKSMEDSVAWLPAQDAPPDAEFDTLIIPEFAVRQVSLQEFANQLQKLSIDSDPHAEGISLFLNDTPERLQKFRISLEMRRVSVKEILNAARHSQGLEFEIRGDCAVLRAPIHDPWK